MPRLTRLFVGEAVLGAVTLKCSRLQMAAIRGNLCRRRGIRTRSRSELTQSKMFEQVEAKSEAAARVVTNSETAARNGGAEFSTAEAGRRGPCVLPAFGQKARSDIDLPLPDAKCRHRPGLCRRDGERGGM